MQKFIDLHSHSSFSDGSFSPTELIKLAAQAGVTHFSITDHDTISGQQEALTAAQGFKITYVTACEFSCEVAEAPIEILGYWLPLANTELQDKLKQIRFKRLERLEIIIKKLQNLAMPVNLDLLCTSIIKNLNPKSADLHKQIGLAELYDLYPDLAFGSPHIAQMLVEQKLVGSAKEAYSRFLGKGKAAHVYKLALSPCEAVEFLKSIGAVSSLAHPLLLALSLSELEAWVKKLAPLGLTALEAYHSEHSPAGTRKLLELAQKYNLLLTGGSDFHGTSKPKIKILRGNGSLRVPECVWDSLVGFVRG